MVNLTSLYMKVAIADTKKTNRSPRPRHARWAWSRSIKTIPTKTGLSQSSYDAA